MSEEEIKLAEKGCPQKLKGKEHPSCFSCLQWDKKQFKICYPLLGQTPPHKDRFKHRSELQTVLTQPIK